MSYKSKVNKRQIIINVDKDRYEEFEMIVGKNNVTHFIEEIITDTASVISSSHQIDLLYDVKYILWKYEISLDEILKFIAKKLCENKEFSSGFYHIASLPYSYGLTPAIVFDGLDYKIFNILYQSVLYIEDENGTLPYRGEKDKNGKEIMWKEEFKNLLVLEYVIKNDTISFNKDVTDKTIEIMYKLISNSDLMELYLKENVYPPENLT